MSADGTWFQHPPPSRSHRVTLDEVTLDEALAIAEGTPLRTLMSAAAARRDDAHGDLISYSPKVFIPLTRLCRDVCHYCTFAIPPRPGEAAFLSIERVIAIAEAGRAAGCTEALFTLGDKPELRYRLAQDALSALGHGTTLSYLTQAAGAVLNRTGLLPHLNAGVMDAGDISRLAAVSASQGLMLETISDRLREKGQPHHGSPDKAPAARLATIEAAGMMGVPFTSGLLIGIGETRAERIAALIALRDMHARHGHIQEIIIQNFCPKQGTRMEGRLPAPLDEQLWTIAMARLIMPPEMNIQAPPNLRPGALAALIAAGINDWGGVSPVTPDHVNPEAPWPRLPILEAACADAGKQLVARLPIYPGYVRHLDRWAHPEMRARILRRVDADGWAVTDGWSAGAPGPLPNAEKQLAAASAVWSSSRLTPIIGRAMRGERLGEADIAALFRARGPDVTEVLAAANALRAETCGDAASYVVTRNINYTNICGYHCRFCAFSKGKTAETLRGKPYNLPLSDIAAAASEAARRGATEVCMQGGIHPNYTGDTYLDILRAVKAAVPGIHVHAFSPLEVHHGALTLGLSLAEFLSALKEAGLGSLPGTAAEILDDEVRAVLCADKINTARWLEVIRTAHGVGLRTTATIMFGHVDRYENWARHLLAVRDLQEETGGFTEIVPLPFVHMEAPISLKGQARAGPSFREAVLMHAVCRLALHPHIVNVQASWVKLGPEGMALCLSAGANDMGGTLMHESITRAAGASHGQEMTPERLEGIAREIGRKPFQRTTLYARVSQRGADMGTGARAGMSPGLSCAGDMPERLCAAPAAPDL